MRIKRKKKKGTLGFLSFIVALVLALSACSSGSESVLKSSEKKAVDVPAESGEVASAETPEEETSSEEEVVIEKSDEFMIEGTVNPDGYYSPYGNFDMEDDQFVVAEIDGLTFTEPKPLKHAIGENEDGIERIAFLEGANEEYLILITGNKELYAYDREDHDVGILATDVYAAYIDPVDNLVMFVVKEEEHSSTQHVYYWWLDYIGTNGSLGSLTNVEDITMAYHDGAAYVTFFDLVNPEMGYLTDAWMIEDLMMSQHGKDKWYFMEDTSPAFGYHNGRPITYNPIRESIGEFQYGFDSTIQIEKVTFKDHGKLIAMDMNNNGDYFYLLESFEESGWEANELYVNGERVKGFQSPLSPVWLDDERIILEDFGVLYLYNTKQKEKHIILDGSSPFLAGDKLVFQFGAHMILEVEIQR